MTLKTRIFERLPKQKKNMPNSHCLQLLKFENLLLLNNLASKSCHFVNVNRLSKERKKRFDLFSQISFTLSLLQILKYK